MSGDGDDHDISSSNRLREEEQEEAFEMPFMTADVLTKNETMGL